MAINKEKEFLIKYITNILEPKNNVFGNLPICPFVKKERLKNKILFEDVFFETEPSGKIINLIRQSFLQKPAHTLLAYDKNSKLDVKEFIEYGQRLCEIFLNEKIISIALHPKDPFNIIGEYTRRVPFHTMLIQYSSEIVKAKRTLDNTEYYKNWTKEDLEDNYTQFAKYL